MFGGATSLKMIVLGDTGVGKTSLVSRLNNTDLPDFAPTIGCNFTTLRLDAVKINVWDTAGQERYHSILDLYFQNVDICLLVYDVHHPSTLIRIFEVWLPRYLHSKYNNAANYEQKLFYLIGNKDDQENADNRQILQSYRDIITKYRIKMWSISALKNLHVESLIRDICVTSGQQIVPYKTEHAVDSKIVKIVSEVNADNTWLEWMKGSCTIL